MSIRRLQQKVPSLVFCVESTMRRKDVAPSVPIRKLSRELAASFSSCDGSVMMANAKFTESDVRAIPMPALIDTLGCLSPLPKTPKTPKRPVYRLTIQQPTRLDVAPTVPQRTCSPHESCSTISSFEQESGRSKVPTNKEESVENLLLNISNHSTLSKKTTPNKKRVGDLLLNISNHSTQSFISTSSRSTAWSNHWMNKSYSRIRM